MPFSLNMVSLPSSRLCSPCCPFAGRASEMPSSPGTLAGPPVSCIISSRTFVTDTTYTGRLQFVFFLGWFFFLFLNKHVSWFSYFLFFEYIAQHFIIRKGFTFQAKSFFFHPGGANVYYFLKEVSGCLCGHLQRGQNGQACRIQV